MARPFPRVLDPVLSFVSRSGRRAGHRGLRRDLHGLLDGELDAERAGDVVRHLDECWACSGEAELLRRMKYALASSGDRRPADLAVARLRRWVR